jgi:hypothetical protein
MSPLAAVFNAPFGAQVYEIPLSPVYIYVSRMGIFGEPDSTGFIPGGVAHGTY